MLTLCAVSKRYGRGPWILRDVSLVFAPGSMTRLSGVNGSGKSTLLRVIAGLSLPTSGTVAGLPARMAVVPDRFVPAARMPARSYLEHHARIRGVSAGAATARIAYLADVLGVVPGVDVPLGRLSKGNLQKIGLAQALLAPVDLLVMDEPLTALDDSGAAAARGLIVDAVSDGAACVVSSPVVSVLGAVDQHLVVRDGAVTPAIAAGAGP